jgi:hypothetical protein
MSPFERLRGAHLTGHPVLEDLIFSVLSILVLAVAISAMMAPASGSLTATVTAAHAAPPNRITMYGTLVDGNGDPISGATISVDYKDGKKAATAVTASDGSWGLSFKDGPGPYLIKVTVMQNGTPVTGQVTIDAAPRLSWGVQMVFTQPSSWVFVPLPGY